MSDKIAVVYIGPKEKKRDTVTGSRLIFPRNEPVEIDSALAYQLLDFPTVFVRQEALKGVLDKQAEQAKARAEQEAYLLELSAREAQENSFVLLIGDAEVDIAKLTSVQLATLVESEELDLKQAPQEKVDDFRVRIRDAVKAKYTTQDGEKSEQHDGRA
ncbi:TPA: hypothetical protein PXS19_002497 [Yersinia enterocolitica]|uniref:hypothetical protein n=1 Tax=Yersinia enterocolitica TaxID=630 RepID=UPI000500E105|nr:hypothetical protein [Yersinia enterocolitica]KGA77535.1 hypothetical protein DJ60_946 [Yersinia enterocolitica]HDL6510112.1 hypothetical protein [Yersinia enterocolitica]HDL7604546.1 hypothetical protein [Yersinia enterocolitica]HDL7612564.1 hypothetical protein [Yersinia enterocolitica]HDL7641171.1 hypothetical protein [Yersinia enterocolitica]